MIIRQVQSSNTFFSFFCLWDYWLWWFLLKHLYVSLKNEFVGTSSSCMWPNVWLTDSVESVHKSHDGFMPYRKNAKYKTPQWNYHSFQFSDNNQSLETWNLIFLTLLIFHHNLKGHDDLFDFWFVVEISIPGLLRNANLSSLSSCVWNVKKLSKSYQILQKTYNGILACLSCWFQLSRQFEPFDVNTASLCFNVRELPSPVCQ